MMRDITDVPLVQKLTNTPATCSETIADPPAPNANPLSNPLASPDLCNSFKKQPKAKNIRKRPTLEEGENEDAGGESSVIYMKKKPAIADFSTGPPKCNKAPLFYFESPKEITVQNDSRATASLETETDFSKDAQAIRERVLKLGEEATKGKSKSRAD